MPRANNRTRTERENSALNYKRSRRITMEANSVRWMERCIDLSIPTGVVELARAQRTLEHFKRRLKEAQAEPVL